jgi:hypothetical protein
MVTILSPHRPTPAIDNCLPLTVALRGSPECEEELAAVTVFVAVGHAHYEWSQS